MRRSKDDLEQLLGRPVTAFAYPFGRATRETIEACGEAGFEAACRSLGRGSLAEPLNLPRQDMGNRSSRLGLLLKRDGRYHPVNRVWAVRALRRASLLVRR